MIAYIALFSALLSRLTALACGSTWVTSFIACFLNIHRSGVLTALAWLVPHETAVVSAQVLCTSYNHAPCHFMQSHIRKVYACLAVTCHLHFLDMLLLCYYSLLYLHNSITYVCVLQYFFAIFLSINETFNMMQQLANMAMKQWVLLLPVACSSTIQIVWLTLEFILPTQVHISSTELSSVAYRPSLVNDPCCRKSWQCIKPGCRKSWQCIYYI